MVAATALAAVTPRDHSNRDIAERGFRCTSTTAAAIASTPGSTSRTGRSSATVGLRARTLGFFG